jgi:hypothetical protein
MGNKGLLFSLSQLSLFSNLLVYCISQTYSSRLHPAKVFTSPTTAKQAEIRRRSNSSAQSIVPGFSFFQAVSEAVRDGDVSDEDEGEDEEEEDTGNTLEDSQE